MSATQSGLSDLVYEIPVFREINLFFDWFGNLIWYWQIGVAVGIVLTIWVFLKIVAMIFGTGDE